MSILKQLKHIIYTGVRPFSHDVIFEKLSIILKKICNITMPIDDLLFAVDEKRYNLVHYTFKFGTIKVHIDGYFVEFNFDKELMDIEHSIPNGMSRLIVTIDDYLNFKKASYIKRFVFDSKENKDDCCTIFINYNISKKIKMTTQLHYIFNYHSVNCFNSKNMINPFMFFKDKHLFFDTLMDFMVQFSNNTDRFYQVFDQYPLVTSHKRACKTFFNMFIKQYKSDLKVLKDSLLTLKMYSI